MSFGSEVYIYFWSSPITTSQWKQFRQHFLLINLVKVLKRTIFLGHWSGFSLLTLVPVIIYVSTITLGPPHNSEVIRPPMNPPAPPLLPGLSLKTAFLSSRILTYGISKLRSWRCCNHMTYSFQLLVFLHQGSLVSNLLSVFVPLNSRGWSSTWKWWCRIQR